MDDVKCPACGKSENVFFVKKEGEVFVFECRQERCLKKFTAPIKEGRHRHRDKGSISKGTARM